MLKYKTETRLGLVALYDIRSGNGAGQFLQPGARTGCGGTHLTKPGWSKPIPQPTNMTLFGHKMTL